MNLLCHLKYAFHLTFPSTERDLFLIDNVIVKKITLIVLKEQNILSIFKHFSKYVSRKNPELTF